MPRLDDLLSELDLLTIDRQAVDLFGAHASASLADKRRIAVHDWLAGELRSRGYDPNTHLLRMAPDAVYGLTGSTLTDVTARLGSRLTNSPVPIGALVSSATDSLLIGHHAPFKAVAFTMMSSVNVTSMSAASVTYWDGKQYASLSANSFTDETILSGISLAGGGVMRFRVPENWTPRPIAEDAAALWVYPLRVQFAAVPTGALYQVLPVRISQLTTPAAFYALHLLYLESAKGARPHYADLAESFAKKAYTSFTRVVGMIADEFDVDKSGAVVPTEASSVTPDIERQWNWERG